MLWKKQKDDVYGLPNDQSSTYFTYAILATIATVNIFHRIKRKYIENF